jgi:hypothetical protein
MKSVMWGKSDAPLSEARMPGSLWGTTKLLWCGCGGRSAARSTRKTYRPTSLSSSGSQPRTLIAAGTRLIPVRSSRMFRSGAFIRAALDGGHD